MNTNLFSLADPHQGTFGPVQSSSTARRNNAPRTADSFHQRIDALFSDIELHCDPAQKQVDVFCRFPDLPKEEVYDLWTRLDLLPSFMRGLIDDTMPEIFAVPWAYKINGEAVQWEARTIERIPGECIAWRNVDGAPFPNHGSATFSAAGNSATLISVNVRFDGQSADAVEEQTLKSIAAVFRNSIVALRILARRTSLARA